MSKIYTTVQGDMWDSIAYKTLGDTAYTDVIMNANKECRNVYFFPAGVGLTIPEVDNFATLSTLPPWKQVRG